MAAGLCLSLGSCTWLLWRSIHCFMNQYVYIVLFRIKIFQSSYVQLHGLLCDIKPCHPSAMGAKMIWHLGFPSSTFTNISSCGSFAPSSGQMLYGTTLWSFVSQFKKKSCKMLTQHFLLTLSKPQSSTLFYFIIQYASFSNLKSKSLFKWK